MNKKLIKGIDLANWIGTGKEPTAKQIERINELIATCAQCGWQPCLQYWPFSIKIWKNIVLLKWSHNEEKKTNILNQFMCRDNYNLFMN